MSTFARSLRTHTHTSLWAALGVLTLLLLTPSCGGGGDMPYDPAADLRVTSTVMPATLSGEECNFEIPLAGGCGGPFVLKLIDGTLPQGIGLDDTNGRHHIVGVALENGDFDFGIQVIDTGCQPFITTTASFHWSIGTGPLVIVGADPGLVPVDDFIDPNKWDGLDALPSTVFSQFVAVDFILAGGTPPRTCVVVDDANDPDDTALPLGTSMTVNGRSIVGQPIQVGPNGRPFRLTIQATDGSGQTATRKVQWKITTPAIIVSSDSLANGKCGQSYGDSVSIADGVPPILFELLDDVPFPNPDPEADDPWDITYGSPNAPTFPSSTGFTVSTDGEADNKIGLGGGSTVVYPGQNETRAFYTPYPSEGMYLVDGLNGNGAFGGSPRRPGDFEVNVHAYSDLVPNEPGQHAFKALRFHVDGSEPPTGGNPAFGLDAGFTVEKTWVAAPVYSTLPEFEVGQTYDPGGDGDGGCQLLAVGGVPADGWTDQPHASQRAQALDETVDSYLWTDDWDANAAGVQPPPVGVAMDTTGSPPGFSNGLITVVDEDALVRQGRELGEFYCYDYQLPLTNRNIASATLGFSVGPDVVIITHSVQSNSYIYNYYSYTNRHAWNDTQMTIKKFQPFSNSAPARSALEMVDMAKTHTVPAAAALGSEQNPLGALLSGTLSTARDLDLLRCTIVATGWWDDMHQLNPRGARPYQHADSNRGYRYYAQYGNYYYGNANWQPSVSAVDLPDAENVTEDVDNGIYTTGGRCYHFESNTHFGVFVVRTDGKIYVPFAYKKDSAVGGFGDGMLENRNTSTARQNSVFRTVQMTVSPDGRFAAMKLKDVQTNLYEHANYSKLVVFSLTGEKVFNGSTYVIAGSGSSNTGTSTIYPYTSHRIMHASSMALSNRHLYFLIGTRSSTNTNTSYTPLYWQSWSGHFLMRYEILGGASDADLIPGKAGHSGWTLAANVGMQTTYHHHGPNSNYGTSRMADSYTSYGDWPYNRYWAHDGMNFNEHGQAPTPFRVSRNGKAVTFLAGQDFHANDTYDDEIYLNYCWVDYDGTGAARASKTRRHSVMGSGRSYAMMTGPQEYCMWGRYNGPTPGLEISDDGLRVAFTYNANTGFIYANQSYSSGNHSWLRYRENIVLCKTTTADKWATYSTTAEENVTSSTFGGSHKWRFGALTFTANDADDGNEGLVFFGGAPVYYSNTTTWQYNGSYWNAGSFYLHKTGTANSVTQMIATSEGGNPNGEGRVYTSSSPMNPSATSGLNNRFGAISPYGGFMSRNRNFLYVMSLGALASNDQTACQLVALNVRSTNNSAAINSHADGRGFKLSKWPARRGFLGNYYYGPGYALYYSYLYGPNKCHGASQQVMAKDTGWVYWGTGYEYSGPSQTTSTYYGGPVYPTYYLGAYGYGGVGVYGFNADMGGEVAQINEPSLAANNTNLREVLHYIEVTRDGKRLAYVSSNHYYYSYYSQEFVTEVHNLDFSSGKNHTAFNPSNDAGRLESGTGRASESMAFTNGPDVYYAFKQGAGNETNMELSRKRLDTATNSWDTKRWTTLPGRMHVLFAGR